MNFPRVSSLSTLQLLIFQLLIKKTLRPFNFTYSQGILLLWLILFSLLVDAFLFILCPTCVHTKQNPFQFFYSLHYKFLILLIGVLVAKRLYCALCRLGVCNKEFR